MIEITYKPDNVISEIRRTLQTFKPEPSLVEIRAVGKNTKSGYFTDCDTLIKAINSYQRETWYFVMNDIDSACYSREQHDKIIKWAKTTTTDKDIINREWLLIDCDPIRISGTSASDEEKQHAWNTLNQVYDFLQSRGYSEPVICDSGNGYHLLYRIDVPNTKEVTTVIVNSLKLLDLRFTDEHVQVDTVVYNPARITKLYGTYATKGADTPDRPHRQSYIIQAPTQIEITDISLIQSIADMLPSKPEKPKSNYNGGKSAFDVRDFIQKHGIAVHSEIPHGDLTLLRLEQCPFNPEHQAPDSAILLFNNGGYEFKCFHDSCSNNHWKEFRTHFDPDVCEKKTHVTVSKKASSEDGYSENDCPDFEFNPDSIETWEQLTDYEMLFELLSCRDNAELIRHETNLIEIARSKFQRTNDFKKILKGVHDDIAIQRRERFKENNPNGLYFTNAPIELKSERYRGDDSGVKLYGLGIVIPQPLLITKQYEDIESGLVKVELAFMDRGQWKRNTVEREIIANRNKIITLANIGLMVTSDNASEIVTYLQELQTENPIPTQKSISHLGYVGKKFVPYDTELIYTGDTAYTDIYKAIHSKGSRDEWVKMYHDVRNDNIAVRTAVASSFASPLIHVFGKLPYFCHLCGDSDSGKTVLLKLACSVWGEPDTYIRDLNSTTVGAERTAYFFHNLPYVLDELMTVKNDDAISKMIYMLTQGQGRTRGTIRGIDTVLQWRCAFITSGEQPLTQQNSATGEFNRIIDVPVSGKIFKNPSDVYAVCHENYGHAGQFFIEHVAEYKPREILNRWESLLNQNNTDISGKHRMSLALILTADELCNRMLFDMDEADAINDTVKFYQRLSKMIISTSDSDLTTRAYEFICNWLGENYRNFHKTRETGFPVQYWGKYSEGKTSVHISGNALREALAKAGFNYDAVLKGLADRNLLINNTRNKKNIKQFFINGVRFSGIELILPTG